MFVLDEVLGSDWAHMFFLTNMENLTEKPLWLVLYRRSFTGKPRTSPPEHLVVGTQSPVGLSVLCRGSPDQTIAGSGPASS